jgi:hypothetical protein
LYWVPNLVSVWRSNEATNLGTNHDADGIGRANGCPNQASFPGSVPFPDRQAILESFDQPNGRTISVPKYPSNRLPKFQPKYYSNLCSQRVPNRHPKLQAIVDTKWLPIVEAKSRAIYQSIDGAYPAPNFEAKYCAFIGTKCQAIRCANEVPKSSSKFGTK